MNVMNYTPFMTFTNRPLQAKNKMRAASTGRAGGTSTLRKPSDFAVRTAGPRVGMSVLRKHILRQVELAVARTRIQEEDLQAIVERKVFEALARRVPAQLAGLNAARERGAIWAREEYGNPENLSLNQAATHTGISGRVINERRNAWRYFALVPHGQQRGFRFPRWQFDADNGRLAAVLAVLRDANAGCWTVHSFMITPNAQLEGTMPRDWILDSQNNLERVLQVARARFTSDQGAG